MLIRLFTLGAITINLEIWMLIPIQFLYIIYKQEYMHRHGEALQKGSEFIVSFSN